MDEKTDTKPADTKADPSARLAEIEKANAELTAKIKAAEDADAKRASDTKKKADEAKAAKAIEEGKAKELAGELGEKLKAAEAERERLAKLISDRADAAIKALPEPEQKRLTGYKDRVPTDVWLQLVDDATAAASSGGKIVSPAPPAAGGNPGVMAKDGHTPKPVSLEVLDAIGRPEAAAQFKKLHAQVALANDDPNGPPTGTRKFSMSIKDMFGGMSRKQVHQFGASAKGNGRE